jgi:hypothetical protein
MKAIEEIIEALEASHVISYRLQNTDAWAGYSPANGKFWMMGEQFDTAKEAALQMSEYGLDRWEFVDQCIDDDGEARPEVA